MCSPVGHRRGQNLSTQQNLCIRPGPLPARRGGLNRRPPRRSAWMPGGLFVLPLVFRFAAPGPHTGSPPCGQNFKRREEELAARRRAGSKINCVFFLPQSCLPIAQSWRFCPSLWPVSLPRHRLASCLGRPGPLARPGQIKKVSIALNRNSLVWEKLFSTRSATECVS